MVTSSFTAMGVFGILREALKIPQRNGKLLFYIALLFIVSSSLMFLGNHFTINPVLADVLVKSSLLRDQDHRNSMYMKLKSSIKNDIVLLLGEGSIYIAASCVLSVFTTAAITYASAASYTGKNLNLSELLSKIGSTWKRVVITWLFIILFSIGFVALALTFAGVTTVLAGVSVASATIGALVGVLLLLLLVLYLGLISKMGLAASILEEGIYGMGAIGKAEELIKGRKKDGIFLSFVLTLISMVIVIFGSRSGDANHIGIGLVLIGISSLYDLFVSVAYTIFYFECKKELGEKIEIEVGNGYNLVSTVPHVDPSLL